MPSFFVPPQEHPMALLYTGIPCYVNPVAGLMVVNLGKKIILLLCCILLLYMII